MIVYKSDTRAAREQHVVEGREDILELRLVSYWNPHFQIPLIIDDKSY